MQDAMTCSTDIRHPVWCKHVGEDAPLAGDPLGSGTFYDRLGAAEPDGEHEGRTFTVDAGETLAYAISATPVQIFDPESRYDAPRVRLDTANHELLGTNSSVYLTLEEVDRVIRMLQKAAQIL